MTVSSSSLCRQIIHGQKKIRELGNATGEGWVENLTLGHKHVLYCLYVHNHIYTYIHILFFLRSRKSGMYVPVELAIPSNSWNWLFQKKQDSPIVQPKRQVI